MLFGLLVAFLAGGGMGWPEAGVEATGTLIIEVENIATTTGIIWVGIYDSAPNFLIKEKAIVQGFKIQRPGRLTMRFSDLPFGSYAVALFHDRNDNGEMDRNLVGIPSEPFAFSGKPRSKWRLPRFEEVQFGFYQDQQVLRTQLRRWWD